jgi:hypothetical protein
MNSIEDRLARLENENMRLVRTLRVVGFVVAVAATVGLFASAGMAAAAMMFASAVALAIGARSAYSVPQLLQARKLEIVSTDGRVLVAVGETAKGDGAVASYDSEGRPLGYFGRAASDQSVARDPKSEPITQDALVMNAPMPFHGRH